MTAENIGTIDWIQRWAGSYTFISCDYWGRQYNRSLEKYLGLGFKNTLFIHKKGTASFYLPKREFENFGKAMAARAASDHKLAEDHLETLKRNADLINAVMEKLKGTIPTSEQYQKFLFLFEKHLPYHNFMKKTVDFLDEKNLESLLPAFKEARLYSENVYSNTESFFRSVANAIALKSGYNADHLTCLTQDEFERYIDDQELPDAVALEDRFVCSALYFEKGERHILLEKDVSILEIEMLKKEGSIETLSGTSAYPGSVKGVARVVTDPFKVDRFDQGDILVTGMTRPEFLSLIQKAGAVITDAGGILCHAAIITRELKKPCIVGTRVATKILKDGDVVEVDAEKGIVKLIK